MMIGGGRDRATGRRPPPERRTGRAPRPQAERAVATAAAVRGGARLSSGPTPAMDEPLVHLDQSCAPAWRRESAGPARETASHDHAPTTGRGMSWPTASSGSRTAAQQPRTPRLTTPGQPFVAGFIGNSMKPSTSIGERRRRACGSRALARADARRARWPSGGATISPGAPSAPPREILIASRRHDGVPAASQSRERGAASSSSPSSSTAASSSAAGTGSMLAIGDSVHVASTNPR